MADIPDAEHDFTMDFGGMSRSGEVYMEEIERFREEVGVQDPALGFRVVSEAQGLLGLDLAYDEDLHLRLAVRRSDLYIVGFEGATDWLELRGNAGPQINNSQLFGLGSSYAHFTNNAKRSRLGTHEFRKAVRDLSTVQTVNINDEDTIKVVAGHLLMLVTVICEGARLNHVCEYVRWSLESLHAQPIPLWVGILAQNWKKLSTIVKNNINEANGELVVLTDVGVNVRDITTGNMITITKLREVREALEMLTRGD